MRRYKDSTYEIRVRAVKAVNKGESVSNVSKCYGIDPSTIHRWHRKYKERKKYTDLKVQQRSGRPRSLERDKLNKFKKEVDELIDKKNIKRDEAIFQVLRKYIIESKNVRFEGNGYSQEWVDDAAKRGLTNIKSFTESVKHFLSDKTGKLLSGNNILTKR